MRPNGTHIRAIRTAQKMSIRTLSTRTHLDRGYLSRLERDFIRKPATERLESVATALGVPLTAITDEENP